MEVYFGPGLGHEQNVWEGRGNKLMRHKIFSLANLSCSQIPTEQLVDFKTFLNCSTLCSYIANDIIQLMTFNEVDTRIY